jgi:thiol-disulfide isomerase/thioredoxin
MLYSTDEHKILDSFYHKYGEVYKWSAVLDSTDLKYFWIQNLMNEASYHLKEFDFDTVFAHYKTLYPLSEGLPLVVEILNRQGNSSGLSIQAAHKNEIILNDSLPVNQSLNSFCTQYFKDQAVFVDLWASWCIPCKEEFRYRKQLDSILEKDNVKILYISINDARLNNVWLTDVFKFGLKGNHILAGKSLLEDIFAKFYKPSKDGISIPRYILIAKDGKILDPDLPRPSHIDELQSRLSSYHF